MARIVTVLLILGALALAAQVATILLVVGIIAAFMIRPKETIGTFVIFGILAAISAHPALGLSAIAIIGIIAFYRWVKNAADEPEAMNDSEILLLPAPDGSGDTK